MNKKGSAIYPLIAFGIVALFIVIGLGLMWYFMFLVNDAFNVDIDIGQVNLKDVNNATFGQVTAGFTSTVDYIGLAVLLGMVLLMFGNAYINGDKQKLWIPVDIILIVFAFVISVYISQTYETFINSNALFSFYNDNLPKTSQLMLNLPVVSTIVGAIVMLITYLATDYRDKEELNTRVLGYSQE